MNKESYLRKLIKEELTLALEGPAEDTKAKNAAIAAKKAQILALQKDLATIQRGGIMNEEEEVLNEMPFIGGEKDTVGLFDAIKKSSEKLKEKFPEATASDISKIILSKKKRGEYAPEVEIALNKQAEEQAGNNKYTDTLGGPQTLKAVEKALGLVAPKEPKAKAEPKAKPAKAEKLTSKKEDDDMDVEIEDTYYNDEDTSLPDEDAYDRKAAKAAAKSDKEFTGKKTTASKLTPDKEERYQKLSKGIKAKVSKLEDMSPASRSKSPDVSILKQLINKQEVKDLFKAKGVDLKALVSSVIG
jgi:hypothetical protein